MPKLRNVGGKNGSYFVLTDRRRRLGYKPYHGEEDKLYKRLTEGLINVPEDWESSDKNSSFQFPYNNPFYVREVYRKGRPTTEQVPLGATGGIFNLEFSPDGKILSAACEKKNILIFDPLSRKVVRTIENAHTDCVNCVRFLDTRTFASCSDDTTVALWDVRNLKSRIRTLKGHSNWVKNIEYSRKDNLLVTSGFDGAIYTWEFNNYSERSANYRKVFYTQGLMRMRLTPWADRMVVSTTAGFLMVVHDLDLDNLQQDLAGFKPSLYNIMQRNKEYKENSLSYRKLFHAKRNRVEIIDDFPQGNDADIIASLRLHPQGWVAVSRNTSSDEESEWCCVHDIQSIDSREEEDTPIPASNPHNLSSTSSSSTESQSQSEDVEDSPEVQTFRSGNIEIISTGMIERRENPSQDVLLNFRVRTDSDSSSDSSDNGNTAAESVDVDGTNFLAAATLAALDSANNREPSGDNNGEPAAGPAASSNDVRWRDAGGIWRDALSAANDERVPPAARNDNQGTNDRPNRLEIAIAPLLRDQQRRIELLEASAVQNEDNDDLVNIVSIRNRSETFRRPVRVSPAHRNFWMARRRGRQNVYFGTPAAYRASNIIPPGAKIHNNAKRLMHYIEESNTGRGFIKEQCFSPCGRIIASPFGFGVRLLGWNGECSDLSQCVPTSPVKLHEMGEKISHSEVVVSTAFNPMHWQLVTGCLGGKISWHSPVL